MKTTAPMQTTNQSNNSWTSTKAVKTMRKLEKDRTTSSTHCLIMRMTFRLREDQDLLCEMIGSPWWDIPVEIHTPLLETSWSKKCSHWAILECLRKFHWFTTVLQFMTCDIRQLSVRVSNASIDICLRITQTKQELHDNRWADQARVLVCHHKKTEICSYISSS